MDAFMLSQIAGASALVAVVPLIVAALTKAAFGMAPSFMWLPGVLSAPVAAVALAPACGIVADVLGPALPGARTRIAFVAALGLMSFVAAIVWDHMILTHGAMPASATALLQVAPVTVALAIALARAWRRHVRPSLASAWACGVVVLLLAGWLVPGVEARHSATAFALIFATFAGVYHWLASHGRSAGPMAWPHCTLTTIGTAATLAPGVIAAPFAGGIMAAALVCLLPVVLRVVAGPARRHPVAERT